MLVLRESKKRKHRDFGQKSSPSSHRVSSPYRYPQAIPTEVRSLVIAVVAAGALVLLRVSLPIPEDLGAVRLLFWIGVTLIAASLSVRLPGGVVAHITTAPILGAVFDPEMANPFA